MKAFITGMAGFAGGHLARHALACGDEVLGCSQDAGPLTLAWDISQPAPATVRERLAAFAPDAIYHLAAISKAADCGPHEPTPLALAVNVEGTRHVLDLALTLPSRPRVLFVSSSYVYLSTETLDPVPESSARSQTGGGYGRSKWQGEELVRAYVAERGLAAVIARAFQHSGPGQIPRFMLAEWSEQFARGRGPVVVRNSEAWIDLSDVRDVVRAYRLLVQNGRPGEAYNVGSGVAHKSGDICALLRAYADPQRPVEIQSHALKMGPIADIRKLTAATGWRPEISLSQTVRDTYRSIADTQ